MGPDYNHNHNHNRPGRREEKHSGTRYCIELPLLLIRVVCERRFYKRESRRAFHRGTAAGQALL